MALGAALVGQLAFVGVAGLWHPSPVVGYGVAMVAVVAAVLGTCATAPTLPKSRASLLLLPLAALVALAVFEVAVFEVGASMLGPAAVVLALLLGAGSLAGALVGGHIPSFGYLVVVAYVSTLADLYSVLAPSGPSAQIVQSEAALSVLALSWPIPGMEGLLPVLGVGDVVMSALYLAAVRRHRRGLGRTVIGLGVGFIITFATVIVTEVAIPALPALALAFLVVQPKAFAVPEQERRTAIVGGLALTALFVGLALGL